MASYKFYFATRKKNDDFSMNSHLTKIFRLNFHAKNGVSNVDLWRENSNTLMLIFGQNISRKCYKMRLF